MSSFNSLFVRFLHVLERVAHDPVQLFQFSLREIPPSKNTLTFALALSTFNSLFVRFRGTQAPALACPHFCSFNSLFVRFTKVTRCRFSSLIASFNSLFVRFPLIVTLSPIAILVFQFSLREILRLLPPHGRDPWEGFQFSLREIHFVRLNPELADRMSFNSLFVRFPPDASLSLSDRQLSILSS